MKFRVEEQDQTTKVHVSGEITEESDFGPVLEMARPNVVVDLGDVTRINSCGVREWLNFVSAIRATERQLTLERCAPVIVTQLNTIYNFTGGGAVLSVFGPFYCPDCDSEENHLIDLTASSIELPKQLPCPKCGGEMEFEEIHEEYLGFFDGGS